MEMFKFRAGALVRTEYEVRAGDALFLSFFGEEVSMT